ncbi:MAG TPA: 1-deoxy-D-xylulose-5-phosphate reductoisomerase [Candidatus Eremiobacteraceae bacterium]|nr:1-deoxy-D-xylulose-5-phosphate reductoisomerase [Candidatus Eremiobacteraceae bacterium]
MRRIAILGSTGSIGRQALDVIATHADKFTVCGLAAGSNIELLAGQVRTFEPEVVSCATQALASELESRVDQPAGDSPSIRFEHGERGLMAVAAESDADIVLAATDGLVACRAVFAATERGIDIALANKEIAVAAGEPLFAAARISESRILPVDSEHSAVFQCLLGEKISDVRTVVLTASGGPFVDFTREELGSVTPAQALVHPTWTMGTKNTLDSSTLMNKGLEVIEACRLFDLHPSQIDIVVHRQSLAHALVIMRDGSVKAQIASPDMRMPIGLALAYPERLDQAIALGSTLRAIGLEGGRRSWTFEPVDHTRFPCIRLAYRAVEAGGTYPAVLSAANEEAGRAFLQGKIRFVEIGDFVAAALDEHDAGPARLPEIEEADRWARSFTRDVVAGTRRA